MKKIILLLFGAVGLFLIVHGCHNAAHRMDQGAILYSSKCSSCHNLIEPSRFGKEQWQYYVDKYGKKMTIEEKQRLLEYLASSQ